MQILEHFKLEMSMTLVFSTAIIFGQRLLAWSLFERGVNMVRAKRFIAVRVSVLQKADVWGLVCVGRWVSNDIERPS